MYSSSSSSSSGVGFLGLLTIAFIVLKLTGVIAWSWFWILSPMWMLPATLIILSIIWVVFMLLEKDKKINK